MDKLEQLREYARRVKFNPGDNIKHINTGRFYKVDHIILCQEHLKIVTSTQETFDSTVLVKC